MDELWGGTSTSSMAILLKSCRLSRQLAQNKRFTKLCKREREREREREDNDSQKRRMHTREAMLKLLPTRNPLMDIATLAAAVVLRIGIEVGQESAMVAPPSLASTSAPISRRRREEP
jgi:hypothetical protein